MVGLRTEAGRGRQATCGCGDPVPLLRIVTLREGPDVQDQLPDFDVRQILFMAAHSGKSYATTRR